eukprot:CAMPEP_0168730816 /NCGR_PEP_ID=MMETSP0724-20121128/6926_1 /TAXON_ID=265536 /ORGANISM="Amphiprora sp., Strain CCMP467" /LENGTH=251 /DNA_ID=CAMNT_0008777767 /DNA_START=43 /DNA_END=794 /DNA_ORIENTATION=-
MTVLTQRDRRRLRQDWKWNNFIEALLQDVDRLLCVTNKCQIPTPPGCQEEQLEEEVQYPDDKTYEYDEDDNESSILADGAYSKQGRQTQKAHHKPKPLLREYPSLLADHDGDDDDDDIVCHDDECDDQDTDLTGQNTAETDQETIEDENDHDDKEDDDDTLFHFDDDEKKGHRYSTGPTTVAAYRKVVQNIHQPKSTPTMTRKTTKASPALTRRPSHKVPLTARRIEEQQQEDQQQAKDDILPSPAQLLTR